MSNQLIRNIYPSVPCPPVQSSHTNDFRVIFSKSHPPVARLNTPLLIKSSASIRATTSTRMQSAPTATIPQSSVLPEPTPTKLVKPQPRILLAMSKSSITTTAKSPTNDNSETTPSSPRPKPLSHPTTFPLRKPIASTITWALLMSSLMKQVEFCNA